jgi:hypothetical protein
MADHLGFIMEHKIRHRISPIFLDDGFIPFLPEFDTGIDLIIYRERDDLTIKLQMKSRWTINRKYLGRNLAIAFPSEGGFYLAPHDVLLEFARDNTNYLKTQSWLVTGQYHMRNLSSVMRSQLAPYLLHSEGDNEHVYRHFSSSVGQR